MKSSKKTSIIEPKTYDTIYGIHKYWAKKPYNVINQIIQNRTKKNDIVLDPFSGSGIALIESKNLGRKAVGFDINPIATSLAKTVLSSQDISKVEEEFQKIEEGCKDKINSFYLIKRKNKTEVGSHFIWVNGKLDEIKLQKWRGAKSFKPERTDIKLVNSFTYSKIKKFYPKDKFFHNTRINADSKVRVCDLFTPRNTTALAILLDRINKIRDKEIRELFRLCFSSMLGQTSKMVFVINNTMTENGKKKLKYRKIGSWVIGYWVPKEHFEINVWNSFVRRYKKILAAKTIQVENFKPVKFVKNFSELKKGDVLLTNTSALKGLKKIPKNSIDYIITDPPHGDRIPYLELSQMWNSWLRNKVDYKNEIIVSGAAERKKDVANYLKLFEATMKEMTRVLKPNHCLTLMFNSHSEKTWREILEFTKKIGLKIDDVSTLDYSRKSVVQKHKEGGLRFDFVMTFKKVKSN